MGHMRLGDNLPRTRNWVQLMALLGNSASLPEIAAATIKAAKGGLEEAAKDTGLSYAFWLFTQIPLAAREENFAQALRTRGLEVSDAPTLIEVVSAFSKAMDNHLDDYGGRTDLGEMAQMAVAECLTEFIGEKLPSLFAPTARDVQTAFKQNSNKKQFSNLARGFFADLTTRYLNYFLSRTLSNHVGPDRLFQSIDEHIDFNNALKLHCYEASRIIEDFAGDWLGKTEFQTGITEDKASGFIHVALKKIRLELARGAAG